MQVYPYKGASMTDVSITMRKEVMDHFAMCVVAITETFSAKKPGDLIPPLNNGHLSWMQQFAQLGAVMHNTLWPYYNSASTQYPGVAEYEIPELFWTEWRDELLSNGLPSASKCGEMMQAIVQEWLFPTIEWEVSFSDDDPTPVFVVKADTLAKAITEAQHRLTPELATRSEFMSLRRIPDETD